MTQHAGPVKVKRDGPRGWHWIAGASFDPARHELIDEQPAPTAAPAAPEAEAVAVKRPRGRPRSIKSDSTKGA